MLSTLIRTIVSLGFLGLLAYLLRDQLPGIGFTLRQVEVVPLATGFLLICVGTALMGWRLTLVFKAQGAPIRWMDGVNVTYIGIFFNNFFPTSVGGDVVKAYCVAKKTGQRLKSLSGVLMDRVFALFMFITIPCMTVLFLKDRLDPMIPIVVFAVLGIALTFLALIFYKDKLKGLSFLTSHFQKIPFGTKIMDLYHAMHEMTRDKMLILRICVVAVTGQLINIACIYWVVLSLSQHVNVWYLLLSMPVIHLFSMLPSINGLGIRETGFIYFFKDSIGNEAAASMAILYLFFMILLSFMGGLIYMGRQEYHIDLKGLRKPSVA